MKTTTLYHPSSNSLAERFVQIFKHSMESSASEPACILQQKIQNFLLSYRSTQHATTGFSPAKLFPQRDLCTSLSLVRPDLATRVSCQQEKVMIHHDKHAKFWKIAVGDNSCVTTCKGKSGNLELCYNTPNDTLAKFTLMTGKFEGDTWMMFYRTIPGLS